MRKTTPLTAEEEEQIRAFTTPGTWEREALERLSSIPLRAGSEGTTIRALTLLGMAYVREHAQISVDLAYGYDEIVVELGDSTHRARAAAMKANMKRRARTSVDSGS